VKMKRIFSYTLFSVFLLITLSGTVSCAWNDNPAAVRTSAVRKMMKHQQKIRIAVAGPWSEHLNLQLEGLEMARDELNAGGGVLGAQIELIPFDDKNNVAEGQKVAYAIANDKTIFAVVGHSSSGVSVMNSLIYQYYGLLMFSPLSTSRELTHQGLSMVFRNIPTDDTFGTEAAKFCSVNGWNKVLVYYLNTSYGESLANAFELQCSNSGVTVQDRESYESSYVARDYAGQMKKWQKNYSFDAIFLAGLMPQAGDIVCEIRKAGITLPIIGGDTFDVPMLFKTAGKDATDVYAVTNFDLNSTWPAFVVFKKAFFEKYKTEIDQGAFQGYDALMVLAEGIKQAGKLDVSAVAASLRKIGEWKGTAGPYKFDENGDIPGKKVVIKQAVGDTFIKVQ